MPQIASHLDGMAKAYPDSPAVIHPKSSQVGTSCHITSFKELQIRSLSFAHSLKEGGVKPGDRVLMMVTPGADLLASVYALFRIRGVPIFIDPGMKRSHLLECIHRSKPKHLLGIPKAHWISRLFPSAFKTIQNRFSVGRHAKWSLTKTLDGSRIGIDESSFENAQPDELAAILFTSGSTGSPKGVQYRVRHFLSQISMLKKHFNIVEGHLDLPLLPVFSLFNPVLGMGSVIPRVNPAKPSSLNPDHIVDLIERFSIQHSFGAPVLWKILARHLEDRGKSLKSIQKILMAGAPVPPALLRSMKTVTPDAKIETPYGATEGLPLCLMNGDTILEKTAIPSEKGMGICVGKPLDEIEIRVVPIETECGSENLSDCREQEIGEILVSGPVVTDTYDALPEATKESKISQDNKLWHRMGDAGYLDKEGQLWFCGRVGHRVIYEKQTLFSVCVEAPFNCHPDIKRSALIHLSKEGHARPALAIELEDDRGPSESLKHDLLEISETSGYPMVKEFFIHPSFPVDVRHNAKIHREELSLWADSAQSI